MLPQEIHQILNQEAGQDGENEKIVICRIVEGTRGIWSKKSVLWHMKATLKYFKIDVCGERGQQRIDEWKL